MITYNELKLKQQNEINAFPFGFAFSNRDFEDMKQKLPLDEGDKYYSLGAGTFVRGNDIPAMKEMFARHKREVQELNKNKTELYNGFIKELYNHEYIYCEDDETILRCFGYTTKDLETDKQLYKIYTKAVNDYEKRVIETA